MKHIERCKELILEIESLMGSPDHALMITILCHELLGLSDSIDTEVALLLHHVPEQRNSD